MDDFVSYFDDDRTKQIELKDQQRLHKKFNSKKFPNFRLTWEYLIMNLDKGKLDKNKIQKDLKLCEGTLNTYLCELNRYYKTRGVRWIHSKEKGFIEPAGFDIINSQKVIKSRIKKTSSQIIRDVQTESIIRTKEEITALEKLKKKVKINVMSKRTNRNVTTGDN